MDDLKTRQSRIRDLEVGRENLTLETYAHIDVGDMHTAAGAGAVAHDEGVKDIIQFPWT